MKKVYISGKISDLPLDEVEHKFYIVEQFLIQEGFEAVNPLKINHDHEKTWGAYMIEDLKVLSTCDSIAMIWDWKSSPGAQIEIAFAERMGIEVLYIGVKSALPKEVEFTE